MEISTAVLNSSTNSTYINCNIDSYIEKDFERDISPISAIHPGTPIEFQIPGTGIFYISLRDSYFDIQFKVTNADGTDLVGEAPVGPANLLAHTMFSNIELYLNGKQITEPTNHYHYRAYLETLANYSSYVQKKRLLIEGWLLDTAGQMAANNGHDGHNAGLVSRKAWINGSRSMRLLLRPRLDLFHQDADIPPNTDIRIRLHPNRNQVVLITSAALQYQLTIQNIRFWVRTREVSAQCSINHQHMLSLGHSYRILMPGVKIKTLSVPAGSLRHEFDNLYMGQLPHRVILALINDAYMNGTYASNPFNFQHFGLNYIALRVNGELVPRSPYEPDFGDRADYIRDYFQMLSALDLDTDTSHTLCLNPEEWATGFTFFAFKLFPNQSHYRPAGSVRLEIRFALATTAVINIILLSESTGSVEIDKYKNVLLS